MKIFYVTYWGVKDGLSVSTVYPNLQILSEIEEVESIDYFTVERDDNQHFKDVLPAIKKLRHHPIQSEKILHHLVTKVLDWKRINQTVIKKAKQIQPDLVICRGAMSGSVGTMLHKKMQIPYIVESFEPHADYMVESGVWKKGGLKYRFQQKKEGKIKQSAASIVTVSYNYYNYLKGQEKIDETRLHTVPCTVDAEKFSFNEKARNQIRKKISIPNSEETVVGIYLGKFGGIYYDDEAFQLFKASYDYFKANFYLILLTPIAVEVVKERLNNVNFPLDKVWIGIVPHAEVPHYLSAADFAFSTVKPANCRKFCSPIKDGEYWANGLPIVIPDGIGDDSDIIKKEGGGAIIDVNNVDSIQEGLAKIHTIITTDGYREKIRQIAVKHRNPIIGRDVYHKIIKAQLKNQ